MPCTGRGAADGNHCCYVAGQRCRFLEENTVPGRRWVCGLRREFGSWDAVNASDDYRPVGEYWQSIGQPFNYCQTYQPPEGICCREAR